MISAVVRISVRVFQEVTSCEFVCKSSNTDGAKQQTFQGFNTMTLIYNLFMFTTLSTKLENTESGQHSVLIRLVVSKRVRVYQKRRLWLV